MVGEHISFEIAHERDGVELLECARGEGLRVYPSRGACKGAFLLSCTTTSFSGGLMVVCTDDPGARTALEEGAPTE